MKIQGTETELFRVNEAYGTFATYAAYGDEDTSQFSLITSCQIRLARWQNRNFPMDTYMVASSGVTEECCWELIQAVEQGNEDEITDALCDALIFSCNLATAMRLDFFTLVNGFQTSEVPWDIVQAGDPMRVWFELYKAVGMLSHVCLKSHQKIRGYDDKEKTRRDVGTALIRLAQVIQALAFQNGVDLFGAFIETAERVLKRDFTKNSLTGAVVEVQQ